MNQMVVLLNGSGHAIAAVGPFEDGAAEAHRVWGEHPEASGFTVVPLKK